MWENMGFNYRDNNLLKYCFKTYLAVCQQSKAKTCVIELVHISPLIGMLLSFLFHPYDLHFRL